jgi:ribosome biogenesis protein BRX1
MHHVCMKCCVTYFNNSFGGPTLYQNPAYVSPNETRAAKKRAQGSKYEDRTIAKAQARDKKAELYKPKDPVKDIF